MSNPNNPTITDAKALATKYRRRGVIILAFGGPNYCVSSYGMTRRDCDGMKDVADRIVEAIADGEIALPPGLGRSVGGLEHQSDLTRDALAALDRLVGVLDPNTLALVRGAVEKQEAR